MCYVVNLLVRMTPSKKTSRAEKRGQSTRLDIRSLRFQSSSAQDWLRAVTVGRSPPSLAPSFLTGTRRDLIEQVLKTLFRLKNILISKYKIRRVKEFVYIRARKM